MPQLAQIKSLPQAFSIIKRMGLRLASIHCRPSRRRPGGLLYRSRLREARGDLARPDNVKKQAKKNTFG